MCYLNSVLVEGRVTAIKQRDGNDVLFSIASGPSAVPVDVQVLDPKFSDAIKEGKRVRIVGALRILPAGLGVYAEYIEVKV